MRSWNKKTLLIILILVLGFVPSVCFAIDEIPDDAPRMNSYGGVDIPIGSEPKEKKKDKKQGFDIISDSIQYFPDERKVVATGHASIAAKGKETKLKAEKITMYQDTNEIFAEGNVRVLRNGMMMTGDFIKIDLSKESILIEKPITEIETVSLVAQKGYVYAEDIEAVKGTAHIKDEMHFILASSAFNTGFENENYKKMEKVTETEAYKKKIKGKTYKIKTKEIELISGKERHFIKMKNATIYKGKFKVATVPSVVISSDKNFSEIETMLPVMGNNYQSGTYFGPAALFNIPGATSLKVAPLIMKGGGDWGYGIFGRIRNSWNKTEAMYGNAKDNLILEGEQKLWNDQWRLRYSKNAYMADGFLGQKMPGHMIEVDYKGYSNLEDLKLIYKPRFAVGVVAESTEDRRLSYANHSQGWSTMRMKAQGEFYKSEPIFEYKEKLRGNFSAQYDFTQYGTGENTAVVRAGPTLEYIGKDLMARGAYYVAGSHGQGKAPFIWDRYYYGKECATLAFEYMFNDKISFGYSDVINIHKDNYDARLLAENKFYAKIGPDDFKFCFAYDTVRRRTMLGLNLLVGSEKSDIEFDKFKIKDFQNLEKKDKDKKEEKL